jgi:hypothetical protein
MEAIAWNDSLVDEFDKAEEEVNVIRTTLNMDTFPLVLQATISELKEQVPSLVERNKRLQARVRELKLVVTSLKGLVSGDLTEERFAVLEYGSACNGEFTEWLQRVVTGLYEEFEMRMMSTHLIVEQSPVNSSTESQPERLQPDPVETSPAVKPLVASPEEPVVEVPEESVVESAVESCVDSPIRLPVLDSESPAVHDGAQSSTSAMPAPSIPMSSCQPDRLRPEPVLPALELTPELSLSPGLPSHGSDLPAEESRCDDTRDDPVTVESPNNPAIEIVPNLRPTDLPITDPRFLRARAPLPSIPRTCLLC